MSQKLQTERGVANICMLHPTVYGIVRQRILDAVETDARIIGCVDYGSSSENRADQWSDLDLALFIQDEQLLSFEKNWKQWVTQFGPVLLAYIGGVGHPWVIYDAAPIPLRVDFVFHPASSVERILQWPNAPSSTEAMVLYEKRAGHIANMVNQIVGQSLAPDDLFRAFEQVCGDFWYYLIRTQTKLLRNSLIAARFDYNFIIMGNLLALLRIEAGAVERWRGSSAADNIEAVLSEQRLHHLNQCVPGPTRTDLSRALFQAATLGSNVCTQIAQHHNWDWPNLLARKVLTMLKEA